MIKNKSHKLIQQEPKKKKEVSDAGEEKDEVTVTEGTEVKSEDYGTSSSTSSTVLTENLSPWRAETKLHVQSCRAKYIKEFGRDIHLHSDDSDTMIKLKEKITPSFALESKKQELKKKNLKKSVSVPSAFDEWLKKKNRELQMRKMKENKQTQIKELRDAAKEAMEAKKRYENVERWRVKTEYEANEKIAMEKIKEREKGGTCNINNINENKMKTIPASEWEKIRQAAEDMQYIEPLILGRLEGQGNIDPGKYLTKYVVKPDPAFQARYKHILEAADSRPTEIVLDGDHDESVEDPAKLPRQFLRMLKEEAKKLKELSIRNEKATSKRNINGRSPVEKSTVKKRSCNSKTSRSSGSGIIKKMVTVTEKNNTY